MTQVPDAQVHPHATGPAAKTVAKHSNNVPLKLYSGWFCPFVQRAWLVLEIKGIEYEYKEINPYHKSKELLDLNPRGLVPTLQYDEKPLYESTVICEFLEERYRDHGPKLLPDDAFEKARARIWIDFVGSRIIPSYHRYLQFTDDKEKGLQQVREEFLNNLKQFTQAMDSTGPFFLGKDISLVDIIVAPWALRLWVFDHYKGGLNIPFEGSDSAVWKRWQTWLDAVNEVPAVRETTSEREHYLPIYQRYADNTAQSEMAKAVRSGRGVP